MPAATIDPPTPPDSNDCCGNGCLPCIWDLYYEQQQRWQRQQQALQETRPAADFAKAGSTEGCG